jgi:hypothetical protein
MAESSLDPEKARSDFLIAMYNQLMNDINRHIVVIWQSIGVLFGAFAVFALVEKHVITMDIATTLIVMICAWVIAHIYDASYWYNRNLVIIANIERQFLKQSDIREIHYYFGNHRRVGSMITHLEIQLFLAAGVAGLVLAIHFMTVLMPALCHTQPASSMLFLPWIMAGLGSLFWYRARHKASARYESFLRNSPGKSIDASGIQHGPGHPT